MSAFKSSSSNFKNPFVRRSSLASSSRERLLSRMSSSRTSSASQAFTASSMPSGGSQNGESPLPTAWRCAAKNFNQPLTLYPVWIIPVHVWQARRGRSWPSSCTLLGEQLAQTSLLQNLQSYLGFLCGCPSALLQMLQFDTSSGSFSSSLVVSLPSKALLPPAQGLIADPLLLCSSSVPHMWLLLTPRGDAAAILISELAKLVIPRLLAHCMLIADPAKLAPPRLLAHSMLTNDAARLVPATGVAGGMLISDSVSQLKLRLLADISKYCTRAFMAVSALSVACNSCNLCLASTSAFSARASNFSLSASAASKAPF
mmetsp:Transcript_2337/g.4473  ORF Transcript_2337/g.4473 Transcript_2337/m.4473 type:complete len:315 (-) Transcript_2337:212-1156(-)